MLALVAKSQGTGQRGQDEVRITQRSEVHENHVARGVGRDLQGEPGLANAAGTRQRQEAGTLTPEERTRRC